MTTLTSTLPDDLVHLLSEKSTALSIPESKLMEAALRFYLEHLEKEDYIKSHKQAAQDPDLLPIAEEGMSDYLSQLKG